MSLWLGLPSSTDSRWEKWEERRVDRPGEAQDRGISSTRRRQIGWLSDRDVCMGLLMGRWKKREIHLKACKLQSHKSKY